MKILNRQDSLNYLFLRAIALSVVLILSLMIILLLKQSWPALSEYGKDFFTTDWWNPIDDEYGGLAFIFGTLVSSALAVLFAAPVSIAIALFISEVLPDWLSHILSLFVELIAAIPSIVFGLWGLFYLAPFVKNHLTPLLKNIGGSLPLFQGPSFGIGMLTASILLAIMIIPTITSICREVFRSVPTMTKEAALGLGATRFEMIKLAVLKPSFSGISGGVVLGLGRARGETMAVAMVIGNQPTIQASLFAPAATMASVIANEYAEADSDMHVSALCLVGVVLFLVTLIVNMCARLIVWNYNRKMKG